MHTKHVACMLNFVTSPETAPGVKLVIPPSPKYMKNNITIPEKANSSLLKLKDSNGSFENIYTQKYL